MSLSVRCSLRVKMCGFGLLCHLKVRLPPSGIEATQITPWCEDQERLATIETYELARGRCWGKDPSCASFLNVACQTARASIDCLDCLDDVAANDASSLPHIGAGTLLV